MLKDAFEINGPNRLEGEITPQGAKNEALQILCAVLLTPEKVCIHNVPAIRDVLKLIDVLKAMGVKVKKLEKNAYEFTSDEVKIEALETPLYRELSSSLRGSVMLLGPLLARFHKAVLATPGGDKIGRRRLDTHFEGMKMLNVDVRFDAAQQLYIAETHGLKGTFVHLEEPSVTGTANVVMTAVLADGETTIYNAACEPYVQQLCKMLVQMGAQINGIGTNRLIIVGVKSLKGTTHTCMPDMIEIGSFIGLAAMTQSAITIKGALKADLGLIPKVFRGLGIHILEDGDDLKVPRQGIYEASTYMDGSILSISDGPWPLFTPDLISIALVVATQAKGNVLIHQKMFESRLFFVDNLIDMGAQIILCDPHRATVMGIGRKHYLRGISMRSPDIRAGVSLLIAALSAEGKSIIHNIEQIDRGYEQIDQRLNKIGADIIRH